MLVTKYKISVKQVTPSDALINDKPKNCFIGVSFENPNFQLKYIPSIFEWVDRNFDHCLVIIADFIYRHNLKIVKNLSEKDATEEALALGRVTREKYLNIIPSNSKFKVYNWLDGDIQFTEEYLTAFKAKILNNKEVISDINNDALLYLKRKDFIGNDSSTSFQRKMDLCREYIIEELAFINHQSELGIRSSVYPGTQLAVLKNFSLKKYSKIDLALKNVVYLDLKIKK